MKCPRCLAICLDDDPQCPSCHTPLLADPAELPVALAARRSRYAARLGLVSLAIGAGLGPLVGPATGVNIVKPPSVPGALDLNSLLWGGLGATIGLVLGYGLGLAVFRSK